MQSFTLSTGKTKAELLTLTEKTDLGDVTYDPRIKGVYENEWHSIEPSAVIKPEIDGVEQDYYYKTTKLTKDNKYCAKLYWKVGAIMQEGNSSDMFTLNTSYQYTDSGKAAGGSFNIESGLVDSIFYTPGFTRSGRCTSLGFAMSEELASILDTKDIRASLSKIPGVNKCIPILESGFEYVYSGNKQSSISQEWVGNILYSDTSSIPYYPPISNIFGHTVCYNSDAAPYITISDGSNDDEAITISYNQPESNIDDQNFYKISATEGSYCSLFDYFPQGLPLGVPIVIAPMFNCSNTSYTNNRTTMVAPFIFYMLGITEVPEG